jgi:cell wall-associated NlpC family hydrolase
MAMNIQQYVGIPYSQLDCYALVRLVSEKEFNTVLPDILDYVGNPDLYILDEMESNRWEFVQFGAQPGDVVSLGVLGQPPRHVGLYLGMNYVLHTSKSHGSLIHLHQTLGRIGYTDVNYYRLRK